MVSGGHAGVEGLLGYRGRGLPVSVDHGGLHGSRSGMGNSVEFADGISMATIFSTGVPACTL